MTFQPVVPLTGYAGWQFLQRTQESQEAAFRESSAVKRVTDYFRAEIGNISTAEQLVADRQLLQVALGAFGLDEDIGNRYFIQKILEEGTLDDDALANRLTDSRYKEMAAAFGFGDLGFDITKLNADFADTIVAAFEGGQFEIAVGQSNNDMRLALNFDEALQTAVEANSTINGRWFAVMGNPPLRSVFEGALNLPAGSSAIDIDRQLEIFKDRSVAMFDTEDPADLLDPEKQEDVLRNFLLRSDLDGSGLSSGSIALSLLRS